jgi:hypothetical protein
MNIKTPGTTVIARLIIAASILAYFFSANSCANQGVGPGGGPRDSIPPLVINSHPQPFETNYEGKEVRLTFDEYVVATELNNKLVISPPLAAKSEIKTKGKSIVIQLKEDLIPGRTYSFDFQDGIKDYNEGNQIESFRMLFSTYDKIDTLRISGYLLDAFTLEPVENAMATLYSIDEDSLFTSLVPDYIAKTNKEGFFMFDNLAEGTYRLFGLVDADNNYYYNNYEQISFSDSLLKPEARFVAQIDTLINEGDTVISNGYTEYSPMGIYQFLFTEEEYLQFLDNYQREAPDQFSLVFSEALTDSFRFNLLPKTETDVLYTEFNKERDSLNVWITDTLIAGNDSLYLELSYTVSDSTGLPISKTDTLDLFYFKKNKPSRIKKEKEEEPDKEHGLFSINTNLTANNFDLNKPILVTMPAPVKAFNDTVFHLQKVIDDSTHTTEAISIKAVEGSKRKFIIEYEVAEASAYRLMIDSASITTFTGLYNQPLSASFKTQSADHYGTAIFNLSGVDTTAILQLVKNNDKEALVKELYIDSKQKGKIRLDFLKPDKYKAKLIIDSNGNGKWDGGSFEKKLAPEKVFYFPKVINIKSNWDLEEDWTIDLDHPDYQKPKEEEKKEQGKKEQGKRQENIRR